MAKKYTEEELRQRKNARQREYARRTNYKANQAYNKRTYKSYRINLKIKEDADIIHRIEKEKKQWINYHGSHYDIVKRRNQKRKLTHFISGICL